MSAIFVAEPAEAISEASGAAPGFVGMVKASGWIILKIDGLIEMTKSPVRPSPRLDLILARFPLCLLC